MRIHLVVVVGTIVSCGTVLAQTQRAPNFTQDKKAIAIVYADGNIKDALGQDDTKQLAAASLGLGFGFQRFSLDIVVNTIGNAAPLERNFGTTLLAPASGASLAAGLVDIRYLPRGGNSDGFLGFGARFYGTVSSAQWKTDPNDETLTGVVVGGFGVGGFATLQGLIGGDQKDQEGTEVGALFDFGLAVRAIGGDIASNANSTRFSQAIPGAQKVRVGLEVGLQLRVNGAKASFTYYAFGGPFGGDDVPGLTRGQVVAGFSVQSPLFKGTLSASK